MAILQWPPQPQPFSLKYYMHELVNEHDFRSLADGIAIPYGV